MYVLDFSAELRNTEASVTLRKSDSTTDAFPVILEFLRANKGNTCVGIIFRHSYRWVEWAAQIF